MFSSSTSNSLQRQRGAIGLFGVMTLLLAVLFTALAVDSGRLWMQQRKLQSIADIASIQAARQLGCATNVSNALAAAQAAANANGYAGSLSASPNAVQLGAISTNNGIRNFTPNAGQEAVRVYATQSVPASLIAGGIFGGQVLLNAEAVSSADPAQAAFSAGSFLASIDTEDSLLLNGLLGGLLGSPLELDVLSYRGLAATHFRLGDLYNAYGQVGGMNQLLSTEMQLGQLLNLMSEAALESGTANSQATLALQKIGASVKQNATLSLGDILTITSPDQDAARDVNLNVLSLITAAAMFAHEDSGKAVELEVGLPGVEAYLGIGEAPKLAIGPAPCTTVSTAQLSLIVNASVAGVLSLALNLEAAQGTASLRSISDDGSQAQAVIAATPGIASLSGTASIAGINIGINLPVQPTAEQLLQFEVPHPVATHLPETRTVSSSVGDSLENALSQPNVLSIPALSFLLEPIVTPIINNTLSPLLGEIARVLLDPLLELLGIRLGGMDVTLEDVQLHQPKPLII